MKTKHPIYIIDNASEFMTQLEKSKKSKINQSIGLKSSVVNPHFSTEYYQLNRRCESSGNSEFCMTGALKPDYEDQRLICVQDNGSYDTWKKIDECPGDKIGELVYKLDQFCFEDVSPYSINAIIWNTYERDWDRSPKWLGMGSGQLGDGLLYQIILDGRRRYDSDWYDIAPTSNMPLFPIEQCVNNGYIWIESVNARHKIINRTEI